jgi:hypothetical protein
MVWLPLPLYCLSEGACHSPLSKYLNSYSAFSGSAFEEMNVLISGLKLGTLLRKWLLSQLSQDPLTSTVFAVASVSNLNYTSWGSSLATTLFS